MTLDPGWDGFEQAVADAKNDINTGAPTSRASFALGQFSIIQAMRNGADLIAVRDDAIRDWIER
jgi:hypothetical protein